MTRTGASPPPVCTCGHRFHRGECNDYNDLREVAIGKGALVYGRPCHCPDGELDGDR